MTPSCKTIWMDPKDVATNPENARDHSEEQDAVVSSLVEKYGWVRPLLYNSRLDRLVDGHERLALAIQQNWPLVPVWVVDLDENEEAELILALDESGKMGTWNPSRTQSLIDKAADTSAAVRKLIDGLAKREGLAEYVDRCKEKAPVFLTENTLPAADRVSTPEQVDPAIAERAMAAEPPSLSASRVRLVQLFVDKDQVELFNEWCDDLMEMWGVTSVTDAVMRTLSDAHLAYLRGGRRSRS